VNRSPNGLLGYEFQYSAVGSDLANSQSLAGRAIGERKYVARSVGILRRYQHMQPGDLNIIDQLVNSQQTAITGANGQSLDCDQRWQILAFAMQELYTFGNAPRREVGASEFADLHVPSEAIL